MSTRAALVTGGSSGIGLAIGRALAEEGYGVTLCADRAEELATAAAGLRADGLRALGVVADVGVEREVTATVGAHADAWGRLDVLVNCAGIVLWQPLDELQTEMLDRLLAVNLRGVALVTREALPLLRRAGAEHGKALIVNVASLSGKLGRRNLAAYAATKAGAIGFTHSTHREVGSAGIQCTALAPGFVETPMTESIKRRTPAEPLIRPEDVAEAVRFLLRTSPNCHVPEIVLTPPRPNP